MECLLRTKTWLHMLKSLAQLNDSFENDCQNFIAHLILRTFDSILLWFWWDRRRSQQFKYCTMHPVMINYHLFFLWCYPVLEERISTNWILSNHIDYMLQNLSSELRSVKRASRFLSREIVYKQVSTVSNFIWGHLYTIWFEFKKLRNVLQRSDHCASWHYYSELWFF